jgi:hypothetical protein
MLRLGTVVFLLMGVGMPDTLRRSPISFWVNLVRPHTILTFMLIYTVYSKVEFHHAHCVYFYSTNCFAVGGHRFKVAFFFLKVRMLPEEILTHAVPGAACVI